MILFLEIFLTITAWRKGFGALALLPLGFALFIGFYIGANSTGPAVSDDIFSYFWIDILAIVALVVMISAGKTRSHTQKNEDNPQLTISGTEIQEN